MVGQGWMLVVFGDELTRVEAVDGEVDVDGIEVCARRRAG